MFHDDDAEDDRPTQGRLRSGSSTSFI